MLWIVLGFITGFGLGVAGLWRHLFNQETRSFALACCVFSGLVVACFEYIVIMES